MTSDINICARCNTPVASDLYAGMENMHYVCFHLEYEHEGDADARCSVEGCPILDRLGMALLADNDLWSSRPTPTGDDSQRVEKPREGTE